MDADKASTLMFKLRAALDGNPSDEALTALVNVTLECIALSASGITKTRVLRAMLDDEECIAEDAHEAWEWAKGHP